MHLHSTDLPAPFMKDVQDFVKILFISGQTELARQQHHQHSDPDENKRRSSIGFCIPINAYKINVQANAAFVDLLVWASADESGLF